MKVLIAYTSGTGNTEKIANAILRGIGDSHNADIIKIEEMNVADATNYAKNYDIVFLGSPIHASGLSAAAKEFLKNIPESAGFKLAGFVTHASGAYERKEGYDVGINTFSDMAKEKSIEYLGCFDCQGKLDPNLQPMVQKNKKASDEDWAKTMNVLNRHPDEEDEKGAYDFAIEILSKV